MPLQRRKPVPILPLPNLQGLSEDAPVFYLKATGEIFLDYESYSSRLSFLLSRTFQCEFSGKSHLDYFTALQSEKSESKLVQERFPQELKGRVLKSVQGVCIGRLDKLVDLVFERFKERYFAGEKVFVDLSGDKYYARIAKVFPPQSIRDQHQQSLASTSHSSSTPFSLPPPSDDYTAISHKVGTDLNVDLKQVKILDPSESYLYTVQLMDEEHKFEGSYMEVKAKTLSRDRLSFSKSILKRYMRECVERTSNSNTAPWIVKPSIAKAFNIEPLSADLLVERQEDLEGKATVKRGRKPGVGNSDGDESNAKRRKIDDTSLTRAPNTLQAEGPKKTIKYPIEDLDLDPMSIHDGRILRRTKTEVPTLPTKPLPRRNLHVGEEDWELFLSSWNCLNTFSKPLALSPFTMDDYYGALTHSTRGQEPQDNCVLLAEIHAALTNIIGTDLYARVTGSSSIMGHGVNGGGEEANENGNGNENGAGGDETPRAGTPSGEEVDELDESSNQPPTELTPEEVFFQKLIKRGLQFGKRWDRQAKLKAEYGREGWETHLIGAVCGRGGPFFLERFEEIIKHLFKGDRILYAAEDGKNEAKENEEKKEENGKDNGGGEGEDTETKEDGDLSPPKSSQLTDLDENEQEVPPSGTCPEDQYLSLPLSDKLAIINYLITLVMGSKPVRAYLDEADKELTDLRKQRADVNKERKALLERKLIESKTGATTTANNGNKSTDTTAASQHLESISRATSPSSVRNGGNGGGEEDDEDELLTSDNESSIAPSEASGSVSTRQLQKEEKLAQKRLSKLATSNSSKATTKSTNKGKSTSSNLTLDEQIEDNSQMEEFVEKQFRKYLGVSRCRPLGKDRFHCRYWWFDGIGGMDISKPSSESEGLRVPYSTGRIFVQGPGQLEWEVLSSERGQGENIEEKIESLNQRRLREEVVESENQLVGIGEWGFYETPEELDALLGWLNAKGTRELGLIKAITRWKDYIVAGSQERSKDLENPSRPRYDPKTTSTGRPSRNKSENELPSTYMGYRNQLKKY